MPATRHRAPAGRYRGRPGWGDPRAERRARVVRGILALATGLGVAVAVTSFVQALTPDVRSEVTSVEVVDDSHVRLDYEVRREAGTAAYCVLRARDDLGEVARAEVPVPVSAPATSVQTYTLTTTRRAVVAELLGCQLEKDRGTAPR